MRDDRSTKPIPAEPALRVPATLEEALDPAWLSEALAGPGGGAQVTAVETVEVIKELIATRVRPAVAMDGGDITFKGFRDGQVFLNMRGACSGCPSSTATLKAGIENLLRHFVPGVEGVQQI